MAGAKWGVWVVACGLGGLGAIAACGGSTPPATVAVATPAASASAAVPSVGDAGPTSTTVQTLASNGTAAGTHLTALPSAGGGAGVAGPVKHTAELGRSVTDIQAIVASHRDEARACYDNALAAHPGIEGNIDVRWTIDPTGTVTAADIDTSRSEIIEPSVGACLVAVVKKIRFNASPKGFETKAHYPFNFHPHAHHVLGGDGSH